VKLDAEAIVNNSHVQPSGVGRFNHFQKELLPPARQFYERELGKLSRPNRKGWAVANCPFHKSKSRTSFSVNVDSGGFHCFGCGAKGGDVISFLMLRDKCDFKTATKHLGAWDEGAASQPRRRKSEQLEATAEGWHSEERRLRRQYRDEVHLYERVFEQFKGLLRRTPDDDCAWQSLSDCLELLRRAIASYYLLSFGALKTRLEFLLADGSTREALSTEILNAGLVPRDDNSPVEVIVP